MAKLSFNPNPQKYSREGHDDEQQLELLMVKQPQQLTQQIVNLGARLSDQYPLSLLTEGAGNVEYLDDNEYHYPVMDNLNKATVRILKSPYEAGDRPGINNTEFILTLEEKVPITYMLLMRDRETKIYVRKIEEVGNGYECTCVLNTTDPTAYVALSNLEVGAKVAMIASFNSLGGSRGNESYFQTPYKTKNQMQLLRKTYKWEGEIPTQVVNFSITEDDGNATHKWMDYRKWQFQQEWMTEKEWAVWFGDYNKDANGVIKLKDPHSGNVVPTGDGVFAQITNKDSYAHLTGKKLGDIFMHLFRGTSDAQKKNITLFTGTLGRRNFNRAIKEELGGLNLTITGDNFMRSGKNGGLEFGNYFTSYLTEDGHTITVKTHPMFDYGPAAQVSDKFQGLPIESGRMIFLDRSTYEGGNNIKMLVKRGMEEQIGLVAGMGSLPNALAPLVRSSDYHGSSHEYMTQRGIQIMRTTNCLDLQFRVGSYL